MNFDALNRFYTELSGLAAETQNPQRLASPDITVTVMSPVCGSRLSMDVNFDGQTIRETGFDLDACALTRAVLAVVNRNAPGKTLEEIENIEQIFRAILAGDDPALPPGDWEGLSLLAPAKDYKARHDSMMLPFETLRRAFAQK